jgi:hypothetical protein
VTKHDIERIDVFHTDVDEANLAILKQFDFQRFAPRIFLFQHRHMTPEALKESVRIFVAHGYNVQFFEPFDAMATPMPAPSSRRTEGEIDYDGEFGPELQLTIPYAYYLYINGQLKRTISSKDTRCFYFSPLSTRNNTNVESMCPFPICPIAPNMCIDSIRGSGCRHPIGTTMATDDSFGRERQ